MDLETQVRTQITHLALILPTYDIFGLPAVFGPIFLDNETIAFFTAPTSLSVAYTVKIGTDPKVSPPPVPTPGEIIPRFQITGDRLTAFQSLVPGSVASGPAGLLPSPALELFAFDGSNLLQLTNFRRADT